MAGNASVSVTVNGGRVGGADVFDTILWLLFLRFAVPVLGVWYGTSLIADEVEEKTITYLFVRPIRRGAVVVGKYLAYLACTLARRAGGGDARLCRRGDAVAAARERQPRRGTWASWRSASPPTGRSSRSWALP